MRKTSPRIAYDHASMWAPAVSHGTPETHREQLMASLFDVHKKLISKANAKQIGFMSIPDRAKELAALKRLASAVRREFKTLVVIGIGGSDLGARALLRALGPSAKKGIEVRFIGANTDPDELACFAATLDWKRTAFNVISKSGDTIEPMSTFLWLRERLIAAVGAKKHAKHIIATTDATGGTLRQIVEREKYRALPVPGEIGGRFSALTTVGLFPAACAGIDVNALIAGAREERTQFLDGATENSGPMLFAGLHCDAAKQRDQRITVLMPYADGLKDFGAWFCQLWAESLGKKMDVREQIVYRGFTPYAALGATDQHSQVQLYNEGPHDKTVTFIEVRDFANAKLKVPNPYPDIEGVAYMAGHTFQDIIHAERKATSIALTANGRPNGTISVPAVDARTLGGLMMFFMLATAAAAELMNINAYDQPGVEGGKRAMYSLLGRKT